MRKKKLMNLSHCSIFVFYFMAGAIRALTNITQKKVKQIRIFILRNEIDFEAKKFW